MVLAQNAKEGVSYWTKKGAEVKLVEVQQNQRQVILSTADNSTIPAPFNYELSETPVALAPELKAQNVGNNVPAATATAGSKPTDLQPRNTDVRNVPSVTVGNKVQAPVIAPAALESVEKIETPKPPRKPRGKKKAIEPIDETHAALLAEESAALANLNKIKAARKEKEKINAVLNSSICGIVGIDKTNKPLANALRTGITLQDFEREYSGSAIRKMSLFYRAALEGTVMMTISEAGVLRVCKVAK